MRKVGHSGGGIPGKGGPSREDWIAWKWTTEAARVRTGWESRTKPSCVGLFLPGHGVHGEFCSRSTHNANH